MNRALVGERGRMESALPWRVSATLTVWSDMTVER